MIMILMMGMGLCLVIAGICLFVRGRKTGARGWRSHPVFGSICLSVVAGLVVMIGYEMILQFNRLIMGSGAGYTFRISSILEDTGGILITGIGVGLFLVYPAILTVINLIGLFYVPKERQRREVFRRFEWVTIALGSVYSLLYSLLTNIQFNAEWTEQLYNYEMHQPVWTDAMPTVAVLCLIAFLGYCVLSLLPLEKLPPLVTVLSMSAMYLGLLECVLWCVQIIEKEWVLCVFPINCILIIVKTIRVKIREWGQREQSEERDYRDSPALGWVNRLLDRAILWPVFALVLMVPLLGILLCVMVLLGQRPDAVIKAWTETAGWRLSAQTAPPNLYMDEHYLCTVAAGGHEKIVKPLRMGERHGHRVVVNRQLCIANAFEQILEERTPRFHRAVRHFYDTCGFPVARLIRTRAAADVVYILMKPLEWIFLAVLYLCDVNPENRIAVQYLPKRGGVS